MQDLLCLFKHALNKKERYPGHSDSFRRCSVEWVLVSLWRCISDILQAALQLHFLTVCKFNYSVKW